MRLSPYAFSLVGHIEEQGPSESFFVWTAAREKIPICENLIKIGFSMVSRCCMCHCSGESVDHLLIHCSMAFELWSSIFRVFGVQWRK